MILTILTILISVGYSALNQNLSVSGEAFLRAKDNIRISRIELSDASNDGYETYNPEYSKRTTKMYTTLPKDDSSVTYTVKVTNSTGIRYKVGSIEVTSTNSNVSCTPSIEVNTILEDGITEFTVTANYENGMSQDTNLNACDIKYEFVPLDVTPPTLAVQLVKDNGNTKTIKITAIDEVDGSGLSPDNIYKYYLSTSETELLGSTWKEYVNSTEFEISGDTEVRYLWIYPVKDRAGNISGGNSSIEPYSVGKYIFIDDVPTLYNVIAKEALTDGVAKLYTGEHNDAYDESGTKKIFHFYGADDNKGTEVLTKNNVIFGGFCWQMIRTTDTGGTKLIYNGVPKEVDGKKVCTNSGTEQQIGTSAFNDDYKSPAYVGYMHNTVYSSQSKSMSSSDIYKYANSFTYSNGTYKLSSDAVSIDVTNSTESTKLNNAHYTCFDTTGECETIFYIYFLDGTKAYYIELQSGKNVEDALNEMLSSDNVNQTSSTIKDVIDTWYANNMTNYTKYLEDTVFCNDRSISDYGGWDSNDGNVTKSLYFKNSLVVNNLYCTNITDRFGVGNSKAKLTYPVGLISAPEMHLLGNDNIRKTGNWYWLASPHNFYDTLAFGRYVKADGYVSHSIVGNVGGIFDSNGPGGVRPLVSLAPGTQYTAGTGSTTDPYIIDLNAPTVTQETIIDGEREKTVRITISDDYGLSSENKYQYYLSTSETELAGGEWKDYTNGEIFTIVGENETRYLWIYPVMDNAGNINDGKTDVNTPYVLMSLTFKDKLYLYNILQKEYASGSGIVKLYTGNHNDAYDESGTKNIYHFYGAYDDEYNDTSDKANVLFADFCWQMIRTTDTGGTKLIYNGASKEVDGKKVCKNSGEERQIGTSKFNETYDSLAYVGYMYNKVYQIKEMPYATCTRNSEDYKYANSFIYSDGIYKLSDDVVSVKCPYTSLEDAHHYTCFNNSGECDIIYYAFKNPRSSYVHYVELQKGIGIEDALNEMLSADNVNKTNSTIKDTIDTWYANNMTSYTEYLEDTVFCNDRSVFDYDVFNPNSSSSMTEFKFKNYDAYNTDDLYCENVTDRFSVRNEKAKLTYPIGLLNTSEITLISSGSDHIRNELDEWTITPLQYSYMYSSVTIASTSKFGGFSNQEPTRLVGVSPSISLAPTVEYSSGTGSTTDPYVILENK